MLIMQKGIMVELGREYQLKKHGQPWSLRSECISWPPVIQTIQQISDGVSQRVSKVMCAEHNG